jgi:hypothetical protein
VTIVNVRPSGRLAEAYWNPAAKKFGFQRTNRRIRLPPVNGRFDDIGRDAARAAKIRMPPIATLPSARAHVDPAVVLSVAADPIIKQ